MALGPQKDAEGRNNRCDGIALYEASVFEHETVENVKDVFYRTNTLFNTVWDGKTEIP